MMISNENINVLIAIHDLRVGNGIATCLMNYYKYTIGNGIRIDFLLYRDVESHYMDEVKSKGSKVYILPNFTSRPNKQNYIFIKNIISKGYDVVHVNTSGYNTLAVLKIAKEQGVKARIYHAHNPLQSMQLGIKTRFKVGIRNLLYVKPSIKMANHYLACSESTGKSAFFGKNFKVLYNAIDTSRFKFDPTFRQRIRQELNLSDNFVVGVVGRIEDQKNPEFIIRVFAEFVKLKPNAILVWAGDGHKKKSVLDVVQQKKLNDKVILLGTRKDVNNLYSAMDLLLLPSRFEGLGIVFIEAQSSGLICVGSDQVPKDVEITELMHRLPIDKDETYWAEKLYEYVSIANDRISYHTVVENSKYEIMNVLKDLRELYLEVYKS